MRFAFTALIAAVLTLAINLPANGQAQQPGPYADSSDIPKTPAFDRARELVAMVNSADVAAYRRFVQESFAQPFLDEVPLDHHARVFEDIVARAGRLAVHGARSYTPPRPPTHAVLVVRAEIPEQWQAIVVDVEDEPPHRITRVNLLPARPPSDLPKGEQLGEEQVAEQLGAYVDRLAQRGVFSGTVLLAKDGKPILTRAAGLANRDFDVPNRLDTKFNLGSMNKMFTAVAVLQLAEQGKLSLDDPIGRHLDTSWLSQEILDKVTVRHLLTHSSGLGSYFNQEWDRSSRALYRTVEDWKPLVAGETLAFEPGTRSQYSNTGFLVAGAIVEKASGMDYFEYIREHITGPAAMASTDCYELDKVNRNLAVGYELRPASGGREHQNNLFMHVIRGGPAGGGYSTVEDLLRFDRALRSGKLLKEQSLKAAWAPYPELDSPGYGLGFGIQQTAAGKVVGHSGGFPGINGDLSMYLDSGYTVAVLSNLGQGASMIEAKARELIVQGR
jgi:CubicO group peptidase (beta-lactamase class C family)